MVFKSKPISRKNLLVVALLSASSRVLETLAMILPVKAVFVLMKPNLLPGIWFELGLGMEHLMALIVVLVTISLILSKVLHALAKRKARDLHHEAGVADAEDMALITTKITSAIIVMLLFIGIIAYVDIYALLLLVILVLIGFIRTPRSSLKDRIYGLLGLSKIEARIRFTNQILFLLYFMSLLFLAILQDSVISITLLLVMLVGRKFFSELARLQVGLYQKKQCATGAAVDV